MKTSGPGIAALALTVMIAAGCTGKDSPAPSAPTPAAPVAPASPQSCSYAVSPVEMVIPREPWTAEISIETASGCAWTATSTAPWLRLRQASGTGAATLAYDADFNPQAQYAASRLGVIEIRWSAPTAGQNVRITQWGDCQITASPAKDGLPPGATYSGTSSAGALTVSDAGGRVHLWVLSDPFMGCAWSAESGDTWIAWQSPRMHQIMRGDGDLVFNVPAKSGGGTRQAVVTLGGRFRLTVVQ
ncbi:MAG TPA: BACON domain-containing protein [Vicinamibacterales bacterium]|nr:BACON domain-containing protein [Vicinamibacterales bacterium]